MDLERFTWLFDYLFPPDRRDIPQPLHGLPAALRFLDPCPDVQGMTSLYKQRLLHAAFRCLREGNTYLEVGTFNGKSLISACLGNPTRPVHACDDFSEFGAANTKAVLEGNLMQYGLTEAVRFHDGDFRVTVTDGRITEPVGLYFNDGAHDELSQYEGITLVEPLLADEALVIVDDWRLAPDSGSYAEAGTMRAVAGSEHDWNLLAVLPARFNGDRELWWNGVGVLTFRRR